VVIGPGRAVTDLYFDWSRLREVGEDGALLVRPDKHIGWRSMSLTLSLPVAMSVASGLNALAHCVDSMWAPASDPVDRAIAAEGIAALAAGLPTMAADPAALPGREQALYAAYLSAVAFASAGSGLHHKICHVPGGAYNLPHAQTHAVVLPYVLAFNGPAAPEAERRIAAALGAPRALDGLQALRGALDAPRALRDYGFGAADIPAAADAILAAVPPGNPRPVTAGDLRRLLRAAWAGADLAGLAGADGGDGGDDPSDEESS
jgi:maleylacetate reductase